jgi:hypothetical protein
MLGKANGLVSTISPLQNRSKKLILKRMPKRPPKGGTLTCMAGRKSTSDRDIFEVI